MSLFRLTSTLVFVVLAVQGLAQNFEKVTDLVVVNDGGDSRSVNWIDIDGDGDLDLYVSNGHSPAESNFCYLNEGNGTFSKVTNWAIVSEMGRSDGTSWGDMDQDGDLDLYIANWYNDQNLTYKNNGSGFDRVTVGPLGTNRGFSESCAWGDYDNDGDLDLFVANSGNATPTNNYLFTNLGQGEFVREMDHVLIANRAYTRLGTWIDYDRDGDLDLFTANENDAANELYRNELIPSGTADFVAVTGDPLTSMINSSISASWADYDNDGDFDVFVANLDQNNQLFRNDGGSFSVLDDVVSQDGGFSFGCSWGDVDNDGDLDLFVANGWGTGHKNNALYLNQLMDSGTASFQKQTESPVVTDGGWSYGSSFADYDHDGDLDLFVAKWMNSTSENNALFRNLGNANHYLQLDCTGTDSNSTAIGAIVCLKTEIGGQSVEMVRQISGQDSYCGQNLRVHFGLGNATVIDELEILWPSGIRQVMNQVAVDQILKVTESALEAPDLGNRWMSHVTRGGGGFSTHVRLWNSDGQVVQVWLHAYDADGQFIGSSKIELQAGEIKQNDVNVMFSGAASLNVDGPDSCIVTAVYASATGVGASAEVNATTTIGKGFWVYSADWSLVFDGLAAVNVGEAEAVLSIQQWSTNGTLLKSVDLGSLALNNKKLAVLGDVLDPVAGSLVKLTSTQDLSVVFLRGSYPGQSPAVLYTVTPIQISQ